MTVYVCVWFPKSGNIGHASLWVDGGAPKGVRYLSRWPGSLASALFIGSGADNTYDQDISAEGGPPYEVVLKGLNETDIKAAMKVAYFTKIYGFTSLNCATHVSLCLRAGVPSLSLASLTDRAMDKTSLGGLKTAALATPAGVYAYAQALRPEFG